MTSLLMLSKNKIQFKQQFRNLNYYSMPASILFVVRERFNIILLIAGLLLFTLFTAL